jgi:hypothetical protein
MRLKGKARFGVSLVYHAGRTLGGLRFSNLTEEEGRKIIEEFGRPADIVVSRENKESQATDTKEQAQQLASRLKAELGFPLVNDESRRNSSSTFDLEIRLIRRAIKKICPGVSVRRGKGTAYGWIEIKGSGKFGDFTQVEINALQGLGLNPGANAVLISPQDRRRWVEWAVRYLQIDLPPELKWDYQQRDKHYQETTGNSREGSRTQDAGERGKVLKLTRSLNFEKEEESFYIA